MMADDTQVFMPNSTRTVDEFAKWHWETQKFVQDKFDEIYALFPAGHTLTFGVIKPGDNYDQATVNIYCPPGTAGRIDGDQLPQIISGFAEVVKGEILKRREAEQPKG